MNKHLFRLHDAALILRKVDRLRFFTITVRLHDVSLRKVADMWRSFSNGRWWRSLCKGRGYFLVYEPHPKGHGWHIHFVSNFYIDIRELVRRVSSYGFGVCYAEIVDDDIAFYVAKYLTKSRKLHRREGAKGVRLVNCSRNLPSLRDVSVSSSSIDYIRDNWRTETGSPMVRYMKLYYRWITSFVSPSWFVGDL